MITAEYKEALRKLLIIHEGYEKIPYLDTEGNWTVGIGYNITGRGGLPDWFIDKQYEEDVQFFHDQLINTYWWYKNLNDARKIALIDMCFMGFKNFQTFTRMISAIEEGDFERAATEMLDSKWARQVKSRATDLASIMRLGYI